MAFLDGTVVNLALPAIQEGLDTGISGLQWVIDSYILVYAALMLTGGSLADRFGRKRLFLIGLSVFILGSLVCAVAPHVGALVAGRVLQGLGAALFVPGTLAILTDAFPDAKQRAQAIGLWSSVSGLALAVGPLVGGSLVDAFGWQSIFLLNLPIGLGVLVLGAKSLAESRDPQARKVDFAGQALAVTALTALTFGLIEGSTLGWGSATITILFSVAAVAFVAFLGVESRSAEPMLPLSLFRSPNVATCVGVALLVGFGLLGTFFFLSLFLQNIQGNSPFGAGIRLLPAVLAVSVFAPLAGGLAGRFGSRFLMGGGMTLIGISLLMFSRVEVDTSYGLWWPVLVGLGAGVGLTMTPMIAALVGSVPPGRAGLASATGNTGQQVGGMLGIAGLGAIIAAYFPTVFRAKTADLGLPNAVRSQIEQGATTGALPPGVSLPPGVDAAAIEQWIRVSFVAGMHRALLVASVIYFVGALSAILFVRRVRATETSGETSRGSGGDMAENRRQPGDSPR